ncbi:MAG: hypothetical protein M1819_003513 [Sarea resinae]|nr:MAG: hypothetical protein M1819_003513 [Sarea resinae]
MVVGSFPLDGKTVVITGGGSGICFSFARQAHAAGAKIIIGDLRLTPEAQAFLDEPTTKDVVYSPCDVTKWNDLQNLVTVAQREFGQVPDVYVPGAGVFDPPFSNFWDDPETDDHYALLDINTTHVIKLTRLAIRALLSADKKGVVLITASVAGLYPNYVSPLYCASKAAAVSFTRCLKEADRLEGIRVMAVCPGLVTTPLWTSSPEKMAQYSFAQANVLPPSAVAALMISMIENLPQSPTQIQNESNGTFPYSGGDVVEISPTGTRKIPATLSSSSPPQPSHAPLPSPTQTPTPAEPSTGTPPSEAPQTTAAPTATTTTTTTTTKKTTIAFPPEPSEANPNLETDTITPDPSAATKATRASSTGIPTSLLLNALKPIHEILARERGSSGVF